MTQTKTNEEVLTTYTLQLMGPPGSRASKWMRELRGVNILDALLETEENLTDLLPEGYSVRIKEWSYE